MTKKTIEPVIGEVTQMKITKSDILDMLESEMEETLRKQIEELENRKTTYKEEIIALEQANYKVALKIGQELIVKMANANIITKEISNKLRVFIYNDTKAIRVGNNYSYTWTIPIKSYIHILVSSNKNKYTDKNTLHVLEGGRDSDCPIMIYNVPCIDKKTINKLEKLIEKYYGIFYQINELQEKIRNLPTERKRISSAITKKALKENIEGNKMLQYINSIKGNVSQLLIDKK